MTDDPWAEDAPIRRRHPGCLAAVAVLVIGAFLISVTIRLVTAIIADVAVIVVVLAALVGIVIFFRGPPED